MLFRSGLPSGSNLWLYTADFGFYSGSNYESFIRWSGTDTRWTDFYSDHAAWDYVGSSTTYKSRCVYYPIDTSYTLPTTCNDGAATCYTVTYGTVTQPGKIAIDRFDRGAAQLMLLTRFFGSPMRPTHCVWPTKNRL